MYTYINQFSNYLMQPFMNLYYSFEHFTIAAALILGIVGSLAPCQLTANSSALIIYGNHSAKKGVTWDQIFLFLLGKIIVFSLLGLLAWLVGQEMEQNLTMLFPWARKLIGPLLIVVGLVLLNVLKIRKSIIIGKIPEGLMKGKMGSFLMGVSFSLAFCPTMFVLFFVTLMPMALAAPYGFLLPSIFAFGTTVPIFLIIFIIWYLELDKKIMKKSRKVGLIVQKITGILLILIGISDIIIYF
ncbi:sulfite exporter TauE/SafE family protein [Metabacillus idriensis]|uniref:urease accessory protein UreH domain-containing protein n=1 Tax=Metabacillus idriensis TaxID=324768 RepID=UPI0008A95C19|nr:sulfite exporter TauE/SafE family protein [Metabacillus idriensis]MCM3597945.1 sulfite exporter TauE/SafE family protein [Metabacillus idriensis]OHR73579.1 cytochrome C biosynthesis protein [Bacillus sp. HMSC76G11]